MRRLVVTVVSGLILGLAVTLCAGVVAAAEEAPTETTTPEQQGIIIKPNAGSAPQDAGDRGGALQSGLFFIVIGGIALIGVLVVRSSRQARADRGF